MRDKTHRHWFRTASLMALALASLDIAGCVTTKPKPAFSAAEHLVPPPPPPPAPPKPPALATAADAAIAEKNAQAAEASAARAEVARARTESASDDAVAKAQATEAALAKANAAKADAARRNEDVTNSAVRYVGVSRDHWPIAGTASNEFQDLYTKLYFVGPDQSGAIEPNIRVDPVTGQTVYDPSLRDYNKEKRPYLARIFSSDSKTVTLLVSVDGVNPLVTYSAPLFSITYSSGKTLGNTWATNFLLSNTGTPLIKISPNTALTVHASVKVSNDLKSQGAAIAIGAITKAVQIAAPQSTLLTPLSSPNVTQTANAIDDTLSGLLSYNLSENIEFGQLMSSWQPMNYITIYGCAPFMRVELNDDDIKNQHHCGRNVDQDGHMNIKIGEWQLKLTCPRPSVFDARDICSSIGSVSLTNPNTYIDVSVPDTRKSVYSELAQNAQDSQIMSFELASGTSILAYVPAQTWYSTFIGIGDNTKRDESAYTEFCAGAMSGLEAVGLNQLDSALVIRASVDQLPKLAIWKSEFTSSGKGKACVAMLDTVGVTIR